VQRALEDTISALRNCLVLGYLETQTLRYIVLIIIKLDGFLIKFKDYKATECSKIFRR
jgi:hypothetical protein